MKKPKFSDEAYVIDLCDAVLGQKALRQHRFDFLRGDPGKHGVGTKLPVDAYYPSLNLVIEYQERQHSESVALFDKKDKLTVSGVHRGDQRKQYEQRRRKVLQEKGITLVDLSYKYFAHNARKRLIRDRAHDEAKIRAELAKKVPIRTEMGS